jgi:hypothetical protein
MARTAAPWALAGTFALLILWVSSRDVFWTGDFYAEAYPAYLAMIRGDLATFFERLPGYSGFTMIVGTPAALLTGRFGGTEVMAFSLSAIPGLVALCGVGVAIAGPVRARGDGWWPLHVVVGAGGLLAYYALEYGHPEDLLATALAVGAVLAALGGRVTVASLLLVGAVVSKQWAVLAIAPAALAAPRGGARIAAAGIAGTVALLFLQTQVLPGAAHGSITSTGLLFHPHQIWWPFGVPATAEFIADGHGERMGPEWLMPLTRPMIVGSGVLVALAWWWRHRRGGDREDLLAVLALALLLRCLLDPWNLIYYHLPLVVALAAWEARKREGVPMLTVGTSAACWLSFVFYDERGGNGPYVLYLAWAIPLAVGLAVRLLRPHPLAVRARARLAHA